MKTVPIQYGVIFGKGDSTEPIESEVELTDEEEKIYDDAIANEIPLCEVKELQPALDRAYEEIEDVEIENALEVDDEFAMECRGEVEMDVEELNDLVHNLDAHALSFFGLEDATDEEIADWDAQNLDEIPLVKDFVEGFVEESPFDVGWSLIVEFVEP